MKISFVVCKDRLIGKLGWCFFKYAGEGSLGFFVALFRCFHGDRHVCILAGQHNRRFRIADEGRDFCQLYFWDLEVRVERFGFNRVFLFDRDLWLLPIRHRLSPNIRPRINLLRFILFEGCLSTGNSLLRNTGYFILRGILGSTAVFLRNFGYRFLGEAWFSFLEGFYWFVSLGFYVDFFFDLFLCFLRFQSGRDCFLVDGLGLFGGMFLNYWESGVQRLVFLGLHLFDFDSGSQVIPRGMC